MLEIGKIYTLKKVYYTYFISDEENLYPFALDKGSIVLILKIENLVDDLKFEILFKNKKLHCFVAKQIKNLPEFIDSIFKEVC